MSNHKDVVDQLLQAHTDGLSKELTKEMILKYIEEHPTSITEIEETRDAKLYKQICSESVITLDRLHELPTQPNDYLIDGFLYKRQAVMLVAKDKVGKSILAMQMGLSLTTGKPFLDTYEVSGNYNVLYIQTEGSRESTKTRTVKMKKKINGGTGVFYYHYGRGLRLHTEEGLQDLKKLIYNCNDRIDVLFIYPVYKAITGGDISNSKDATIFTDALDAVKEEFNCSVVVVQHKRKSSKTAQGKIIDMGDEESIGSFAFKAYFDHTINMTKQKDDTRKLQCDTQREGNVEASIELLLKEDPLHFYIKGHKESNCIADAVFLVFKDSKDSLSRQCVQDIMDKSRQSIGRAITTLKDQNRIKEIKKIGSTPYYNVNVKIGGC